jgi:hypothetical protein
MQLSSSGRSIGNVGWPLLFLLAATSSVGVAQARSGKRSAAPSARVHFLVAPDSVKWEAPPAGMFRGALPTDTASHWRYARLEGDPVTNRARPTRSSLATPTEQERGRTGIPTTKTSSW